MPSGKCKRVHVWFCSGDSEEESDASESEEKSSSESETEESSEDSSDISSADEKVTLIFFFLFTLLYVLMFSKE